MQRQRAELKCAKSTVGALYASLAESGELFSLGKGKYAVNAAKLFSVEAPEVTA